MIIELDSRLCSQYNLDIEEALLLGSMINKQNNGEQQTIIKLSKLSLDSIRKVEDLAKEITNKSEKTDKGNSWAEEFFLAYPHKCTRPDGSTGFLRQGVLKRKMFVEYKKRIKTEAQHKRALEFMINDVEARKTTGTLSYMKTIVKYVLDAPWDSDEIVNNYTPYGGDFI